MLTLQTNNPTEAECGTPLTGFCGFDKTAQCFLQRKGLMTRSASPVLGTGSSGGSLGIGKGACSCFLCPPPHPRGPATDGCTVPVPGVSEQSACWGHLAFHVSVCTCTCAQVCMCVSASSLFSFFFRQEVIHSCISHLEYYVV